jgi:hypothetical protein
MIVCPSCQKTNAGNPPRCEFCGASFIRLSEDAKASAVASARKGTRMTRSGLIGIGAFSVSAVVCNLPASTSNMLLLVGCVIFGALAGFPVGYAMSVINGSPKKGLIFGAVCGVLFGLVLSMTAGPNSSVLSMLLVRGIVSGAVGGLLTTLFGRR